MILAPTLTASAGSGAAIERPTFSRDFAGEKTLNNGTGPAITFTRASNATYFNAAGTLVTASSNEPRFDHDPATGASRGLLIEEARTNLLSGNSQNLTGTGWHLGAATLDSAVVDPAGNTGTVYYVSGGAERVCNFAGTGTQVVLSFFAKQRSGGGNIVRFEVFSSTVGTVTTIGIQDFNFTGSPAGAGYDAFSNVTRTELPNGWFRFSAVATAAGGFTSHSRVDIEGVAHSNYVWGIQVESGAFPTSYIPTTTSTATRSADSAVVTPISSFYNQSEGTLFAEAGFANAPIVGADRFSGFIAFNDGTPSNFLGIFPRVVVASSSRSITAEVRVANVVQMDGVPVAINENQQYKSALAVKLNDVGFAVSGSAQDTDTSATMPTVTQMIVGQGRAGALLNGHIRKIAYWPKRLSNTLLQQLTT